MNNLQTEVKTTTQTITQEPEQTSTVMQPIYTQQIGESKILEGQLKPVSTNQIQTSVVGSNIQGITGFEGQTQILNPIYTKEVKETQVHDLGTVQLQGQTDVLNPIYTKEVKETQVHDLGTVQLQGQTEVLNPIYTKEVKF